MSDTEMATRPTAPLPWTTSDPRRIETVRQAHIFLKIHGKQGLLAVLRAANDDRDQPLPDDDIGKIATRVGHWPVADLEKMPGIGHPVPATEWPDGYVADENGIFFVHATGRRVRLCARFDLVCETVSQKGYRYGWLIVFVGNHGWPHEIAIPKGMVHRRSAALAEFLENAGLRVETDDFAQNAVRALFSKLSSPFCVTD